MSCSKARFMGNNLIALTTNNVTFSSETTGYEGENALNDFRSNVWKASGHFSITSSNNLLYINDGSNKTITLTAASYTTPSALATHIQTQLNASSSNWTVTYNAVAGTYRFVISNTGSVTLRMTQQTNAAWDTLGFVGTTDVSGTSFTADEQRNHTSEHITVDFGYIARVTFLGMVGDISTNFKISGDATITIKANNINDFTSPPFSTSTNASEKGVFCHLDLTAGVDDTSYRYWKIEITDKFNVNGPEGIEVGNIYLGDSTELSRNVQEGFQFIEIDPSTKSESEAGVVFFDRRVKYGAFPRMTFFFIDRDDRDTFFNLFKFVGTTTPFYFSLDPELSISNDISEFTRFVVFESPPEYPHEKFENFSVDITLREVV
jgi:hypothetical protein